MIQLPHRPFLYNLDLIKDQISSGNLDYSDVNLEKWTESAKSSPSTPKPSTSKLPSTDTIMLPMSNSDTK
jgi:hypothetical protein